MIKYQLKESVSLDVIENDFTIIDKETGFTASGNKHSFKVFEIMKESINEVHLIMELKKHYHESQHDRIKKSVPNIISWAQERNLLRIIE